MEIKYTTQGLLIYTATAMYLFAFAATVLRNRRVGAFLYLSGFLLSGAAFVYRWYDVGHIPMQNLYEIFLCLGVLIFPITVFCRRALGVEGLAADMLIGAIVLVPAGFVFGAEPQQLPPALQSPLFAPHVAVYMLSYILMTKAAVQAFFQLATISPANRTMLPAEKATYRMICAGFPLLTLGLILGSVWGQRAWGDWWGWDPKEMWSLASWLVYVGYFHFRYMFGKKFPRINALWAIAGLAVIVITLLWVNLSRFFPGLHSYAM